MRGGSGAIVAQLPVCWHEINHHEFGTSNAGTTASLNLASLYLNHLCDTAIHVGGELWAKYASGVITVRHASAGWRYDSNKWHGKR